MGLDGKENGLRKLKIARVATVPFFFSHTRDQIKYLISRGHEVTLITSYMQEYDEYIHSIGAKVKYIEISREISLLKDLKSLILLILHFLGNSYDVVHTATPKAGLLGAISSFIARTPLRVHTFTGQRWVTFKGIKRKLFILIDKLICALNSVNYSDSRSQNNFLISNKIVKESKIDLIGEGSLGGLNLDKFEKAKTILLNDSFKFLFVGRVVEDKGVNELVSAFCNLSRDFEDIELYIIGPIESNNPVSNNTLKLIKEHPRIICKGFQSRPEDYMKSCDVLCLPSYREGFGTVVIEAAATSTPTIGSNIPGLRDSIVDNETGLLFEPRSVSQLEEKMRRLYLDSGLCTKLGRSALSRVEENFRYEVIAEKQIGSYFKHLEKIR